MKKFRKWKEAFKNKGLKVNLGKTSDGQWRHYKGLLIKKKSLPMLDLRLESKG